MRLKLTAREYGALIAIRGMPENVHYMVHTARTNDHGYVLKGEGKTLNELLDLLSEELSDAICPRKNVQSLLRICKKVDPDCLEWIGL